MVEIERNKIIDVGLTQVAQSNGRIEQRWING